MKKKMRKNVQIGGVGKATKESEMLLKIAEDYMAVCDTLGKMNCCLNQACAAWNISLLPVEQRMGNIIEHIDATNRINEDMTMKDRDDMRNNIELLIAKKLKYYPDKVVIMEGSEIVKINDKLHVKVEAHKVTRIPKMFRWR